MRDLAMACLATFMWCFQVRSIRVYRNSPKIFFSISVDSRKEKPFVWGQRKHELSGYGCILLTSVGNPGLRQLLVLLLYSMPKPFSRFKGCFPVSRMLYPWRYLYLLTESRPTNSKQLPEKNWIWKLTYFAVLDVTEQMMAVESHNSDDGLVRKAWSTTHELSTEPIDNLLRIWQSF